MIIDDQTPFLSLVYVWKSTASICSRHLCPAPIGKEMGRSSCQPRFISEGVLNPSDDLRYQTVLVVVSITDRVGCAPLFIFQEIYAYWVLSDPFPCMVWECGQIWIFKITADIWYVNFIFMFAAAPYTTSLDTSSSISSTSSPKSSAMNYAIEKSTDSTTTVSTASSINTTFYEASWWKVVRQMDYCNHCRQVSRYFDKCGWVW